MNALLSKSRMVLCGLVLLATTISLSACDSGGDDSGLTIDDIVGTYTFSQLSFNPEAAAIMDANVLDTLVAAQTSFRLFEDGSLNLNYQFQNGSPAFVPGSFTLNDDEIRVDLDDSFGNQRRAILLPDEFTLQVVGTGSQLQADIDRNGVNMADFSDFYSGVTTNGTLVIRLRR